MKTKKISLVIFLALSWIVLFGQLNFALGIHIPPEGGGGSPVWTTVRSKSVNLQTHYQDIFFDKNSRGVGEDYYVKNGIIYYYESSLYVSIHVQEKGSEGRVVILASGLDNHPFFTFSIKLVKNSGKTAIWDFLHADEYVYYGYFDHITPSANKVYDVATTETFYGSYSLKITADSLSGGIVTDTLYYQILFNTRKYAGLELSDSGQF